MKQTIKTIITFHIDFSDIILKDAEHIFEFEKHRYRLIKGARNETDKLLTVITGSSTQDFEVAYDRTRRLIDSISWEINTGIRLLSLTGTTFRPNNNFETMPIASFRSRYLGYPKTISQIPNVKTNEQKLALSLWNEASLSNSPFLAFINYWSILELPPQGQQKKQRNHINRVISWINHLPGRRIINLSKLRKDLKSKNFKGGAGKFLYDEGRNAILHVTKPSHYIRNRFQSRNRISSLNTVMKAIAKYYIKNKLKLDIYSYPLEKLKTKTKTKAFRIITEDF